MNLVTGHAGEDHISASDIASMLRGLVGDESFVLDIDSQLACTLINANSVQVGAGGCILQGHYARVDVAETLEVESGSVGYKRNDLVIVRYALGTGNVQTTELAIKQGTPTTGTPTDPTLEGGTIDDGDTTVEFALWRIPIDGVNVGTPVRLLAVRSPYQSEGDDIKPESIVTRTLRVIQDIVASNGLLKAWGTTASVFLDNVGGTAGRWQFYKNSQGNPAVRCSQDNGSTWKYPFINVLDSQTANMVFAAPNGSSGVPSFRALVAADIPALAASKISSGAFSADRIPSLAIGKLPGIRRGTVGQTTDVPAHSHKDISVTFGHTYSSAPTVVVGLYSTSTNGGDIGLCSVAVTSVTTTGFKARIFNANSAVRAPGFTWIAVGA